VLWLEDWLQRYPGTLLLITHDRDFLDATVGTIVHFEAQKLRPIRQLCAVRAQRARQLALQQSMYAKQQQRIAHLQSFIDRFRAKPTKAKQAQSRIKMLEKMDVVAQAHIDTPFSFSFAEPDRAPRQLFRLEDVSIGYGGARRAARHRVVVAAGRPDRPPRSQRRRQVDAAEAALRHAAAAVRDRARRAEPGDRLLRAAPGRAARARALAAVAPEAARPGRARAGPAQLPRRLRLPRRQADAPSRRSQAAKRRGSRCR
jgi:hypothetical protein